MLQCRTCLRRHLRTILSVIHAPLRHVSSSSNRGGFPTARRRPDNFTRVVIPTTSPSFRSPRLHETRDPMQVVSFVQNRLQAGDEAEAHRFVATATGKLDTVVAWNALIRHSMRSHRPARALKYYNEMKKRGVVPDTYTYSHLLSGLAGQRTVKPSFVSEAFKIYEHLKTKNLEIKPSIVHTNGLLSVCMRLGDMDNAWELLSKLPPFGPTAPDAATYTVFLRGLKNSDPITADCVQDGRRAWAGALSRWRKGELRLDEYLINAYLELLHASPDRKDWYEVIISANSIYHLSLPFPWDHAASKKRSDELFARCTVPADDFTLGILLRTAEKLQDFNVAQHAWEDLRNLHRVEPNPITAHLYLRCMSATHSGAAAKKFLAENSTTGEWSYVMALRSCVHSGGSYESFDNATAILTTAEEAENKDRSGPGVRGGGVALGLMTIRSYLLVALTTTDAGLIKRAVLRTEKYLTPFRIAELAKTSRDSLPRDYTETVNKFVLTLKKAVYWDHIRWGRFEQQRFMDKFHAVKLLLRGTLKEEDRKKTTELDVDDEEEEVEEEEEEEEDVDDRDHGYRAVSRRPKLGVQKLLAQKQEKSLAGGGSEEKKKLQKVMAGLKKFTPKERAKFIAGLRVGDV